MNQDHDTLLRPRASDTQKSKQAQKSGFGLPIELQAQACKRVAQFSLLMTVLVAIVFISSRPVWQDFTAACSIFVVRCMQLTLLGLSLALFLAARSMRFRHSTILNLGLIYEVVFCLVVGVGYNYFTASAYGIFAAMTLATLVIAVYPMIVPSPPGRTLLAAVLAAAMAPLGVWVVSILGVTKVHFADYLGVTIYPAICVVLAVFGSRIIYGLNRDVAQARDLGSYHLERLLGRGGMGEVWHASHRLLARPAAVKLVRRDGVGSQSPDNGMRMSDRFEREAQVTASLQSPHTVALYDFGRSDEGAFYYIMELLDGLDLESLVARYGPVSPARAVYVARQVCLSLAEAHDAGLVHRDIKPANLLLCHYGRDFDFVKVLDFGMVALQAQSEAESRKLTMDGITAGTPAYMPPEIAEGKPVDGRADLYALGCVLFWLLTGRTVFEGDTPMATVLAHLKDPPPPPSTVTEIEVPIALDRLVLRCLEKDPAQRPQNADALLAELDDLALSPAWSSSRARQWWETHRPKTPVQTDVESS